MKNFCAIIVLSTLAFPMQSFADAKLPTLLGDIDSLTPSVYQKRQRPEPTALREVLKLGDHRAALLDLVKSDFRSVVWREPGVDMEARIVALREASYIALGEWGGPGVQAFLISELQGDSLTDSAERALLKALGSLTLDTETQRLLVNRLGDLGSSPKVRFETLMALMNQGGFIASDAYQRELALGKLTPLELTRLGAQWVISDALATKTLPREIWTQVVKHAATVSESRFAAEALWRAIGSLPAAQRKVALELVNMEAHNDVKRSIERRQRWAEKRSARVTPLP